VVGTLPRGVSKSSVADNFGGQVEHGPHFYRIKLLIVMDRAIFGVLFLERDITELKGANSCGASNLTREKSKLKLARAHTRNLVSLPFTIMFLEVFQVSSP
jgi:hypothetical protein